MKPIIPRIAVLLGLFGTLAVQSQAASVDAVLKEQMAADKAAAAAQAKIDDLEDQAHDSATKYGQAIAMAESLEKYSDQLNVQVESQKARLDEMKTQLAEIEVTQRNILPLIEKMIATLDQFVALDVPFLAEERRKRVAGLQELLGRSDVSTSEKYRRVLEAYQIELDYGRTLDAYTGKLGDGEDARTVQFVRLGRVSLMYQTLDGRETGYWNAKQKAWVSDPQYARDVKPALAVAKKEGAPDLVLFPIPAPAEVQQ
jgi:hypothetical protein